MEEYFKKIKDELNLNEKSYYELQDMLCSDTYSEIQRTYIKTEFNRRKTERLMKEKIITREQFEEYISVDIPSALFHVTPSDIDDKTGAKCEDIILLDMISEHPEILKFESLSWFVKHFL